MRVEEFTDDEIGRVYGVRPWSSRVCEGRRWKERARLAWPWSGSALVGPVVAKREARLRLQEREAEGCSADRSADLVKIGEGEGDRRCLRRRQWLRRWWTTAMAKVMVDDYGNGDGQRGGGRWRRRRRRRGWFCQSRGMGRR